MSPTHQDLSNDTTFSQIKSRVPVPLSLQIVEEWRDTVICILPAHICRVLQVFPVLGHRECHLRVSVQAVGAESMMTRSDPSINKDPPKLSMFRSF